MKKKRRPVQNRAKPAPVWKDPKDMEMTRYLESRLDFTLDNVETKD